MCHDDRSPVCHDDDFPRHGKAYFCARAGLLSSAVGESVSSKHLPRRLGNLNGWASGEKVSPCAFGDGGFASKWRSNER